MALFQRFWQRLTVISRAERLIIDGSSSICEVVMIGAGRIEHRDLICYTSENRQLLTHPGMDHTSSKSATHGRPYISDDSPELSLSPALTLML